MPSFANTKALPPIDQLAPLDRRLQQLTFVSIIGNWLLDFQNTSITSSADLCDIALQLCTCPASSFPQSHRLSNSQPLTILAVMGIGEVLFMPWPSWAKLSFVR
jgi:hypothetical protein